jgi:N-acetylglutamate synthase-like GNAT family acetyltransferase
MVRNDLLSDPQSYELHPAVEGYSSAIKALIRAVQINPMGLHWHNFLVATDSHGQLIGCGQIKPHQDGSCELASIAVVEQWRRCGIASRIINQLIEGHHGVLYLTCRSNLESFYQRFGFYRITHGDMTPYFRRIDRFASLFNKSGLIKDTLLVMKRDP